MIFWELLELNLVDSVDLHTEIIFYFRHHLKCQTENLPQPVALEAGH